MGKHENLFVVFLPFHYVSSGGRERRTPGNREVEFALFDSCTTRVRMGGSVTWFSAQQFRLQSFLHKTIYGHDWTPCRYQELWVCSSMMSHRASVLWTCTWSPINNWSHMLTLSIRMHIELLIELDYVHCHHDRPKVLWNDRNGPDKNLWERFSLRNNCTLSSLIKLQFHLG